MNKDAVDIQRWRGFQLDRGAAEFEKITWWEYEICEEMRAEEGGSEQGWAGVWREKVSRGAI